MKNFFFVKIMLFLLITGMMVCDIRAFSITPGRVYRKIKPGERIKGEYLLSNNENAALRFLISRTGGEGWFDMPGKEIILKSGESVRIPYEITAAGTNLKGEQKASITISQVPERPEGKGTGAAFQTRMTFPVYAFVENTEKIDYRIEQLDADADFVKRETELSGKAGMKIRVHNTGNVHFLCEQRLELYRSPGNGKKEFMAEKRDFPVFLLFPGERKNITLEMSRSLEPGDYLLRVFLYFKFDEDLVLDSDELLKKERVFSRTKAFRLDREGHTLIEK